MAATGYRFCPQPKPRLKETGVSGSSPQLGSLGGSDDAQVPARSRLAVPFPINALRDRGAFARS